MRPLAIDLYCGLGGWAEGFLAEGYDVIGFDIERHDYGTGGYLGQLVIQDVLTLHGSQFKNAACIVASPPCQAYSYRAMPWKRAKALPPPDNTLFEACFRIQREACEAAGRYIPMVVENVRGAQKWVGRARWHFGSYFLWGDVPALMPITFGQPMMKPQEYERRHGTGSWFAIDMCSARRGVTKPEEIKIVGRIYKRDGHSHTRHLTNPAEHANGVKGFTPNGQPLGKNELGRKHGSKSKGRKAASAMIAKIPFPLAVHIARTFKPANNFALAGH